MNEDFLTQLMLFIAKRREVSIINMKKYDFVYNKIMEKYVSIGEQYELLSLESEDKKVIEEYINILDKLHTEEMNFSYLLGIIDCVKIFNKLDIF